MLLLFGCEQRLSIHTGVLPQSCNLGLFLTKDVAACGVVKVSSNFLISHHGAVGWRLMKRLSGLQLPLVLYVLLCDCNLKQRNVLML